MKQTGAERQRVLYHCSSCGYNDVVTISAEDNSDYWQKRSELLARVRNGIFEWQTAQWDYIRRDIIDFTSRYDTARHDIYFTIAIVACITHGFHDMDSEKYKQCKTMFKLTERIYKRYLKDANPETNFAKETGSDGITGYEEYRVMYKKCRNEYRNTKLAWKMVYSIFKFAIKL